MAFVPSPQQQDFFDWIETGDGSCILEAVAGSGKTTTLIEALKLMRGRIFFGAYNKKIADEIKAKAPKLDQLYVQTMHAAGFSNWRRAAPDVKVNENKCRDIFRKTFQTEANAALEPAVLQIVSLAKQAFILPQAPLHKWVSMIDHFDVECQGRDAEGIELSQKVLTESTRQDTEQIDFDDMIYSPLIHNTRVYQYDWVLIDEAQDTNASRRALALRMLKRDGRLVAVGDRHQAIYGFTGADANSLDLIRTAVGAKQMPLTVSYRCPVDVVEYAHRFVAHIQAHPDAPKGAVEVAGATPLDQLAKPGDAILCRFNAPLLGAVYQFIAKGIPAKVEGREIGNGLKALARRWKVKSFAALLSRLDSFVEAETAKLRAKDQESKATAVEDKVQCLRVIINRVSKFAPDAPQPIEAICNEIDSIFGQDVNAACVLLSSIHKSKGREWARVVWLQTGPSGWARQDWELEQENNLCYVATTRAKQTLVLAPCA